MGQSAVTYGTKWFCAVKGTTVVKVARELKVARKVENIIASYNGCAGCAAESKILALPLLTF